MKNTFEMVSVSAEQTNQFYNPYTANNGGGYFQYDGFALYTIGGKSVTVRITDDSCGEFGQRLLATIEDDEHMWSVVREFNSVDFWMLSSVNGVLGIDATALINDAREAVKWAAWQEISKKMEEA